MESEQQKFEGWCVVELFGHQQIAGMVTEQTIAGQGFIRVDVPETSGRPGYSRMFGAGSIYSIIPTSEEIATNAAARLDTRPIAPYLLTPAAEAKAKGLDEMNEMYKTMLRSKDIIINNQEKRINDLAERLLKLKGGE